jgi:hypothetical protein
MRKWSGNIVEKLAILRAAVDCLVFSSDAFSAKIEKAAIEISAFSISDVPDALQPILGRINEATGKARCDYVGGVCFDFSLLSNREKKAIALDVIRLYEACLIDFGRVQDKLTENVYNGGSRLQGCKNSNIHVSIQSGSPDPYLTNLETH